LESGAGGRSPNRQPGDYESPALPVELPPAFKRSHRLTKAIEVSLDRAHNRLTIAKLNHISVEIEAKFGSSFQEETALRMLHKYIYSRREFFLEKHSKNAIDFRITNAEQLTSRRGTPSSRKRQPAICRIAAP
jgi:hypothetical protein